MFDAAKNALRQGGSFVFTVEKLPGDELPGHDDSPGYRLNRFGRYTHGVHRLHQHLAEADMKILRLDEEVIRHESNEPVIGLVITAQKMLD